MGFNHRGFVLAVLVVAAAAGLAGKADAATYVVGDSLGWRVPNTPADYSNWASRNVFRVGDVLVFNFMTGQHDVAQVTKAGFDGCSAGNPIISLSTVGPWSIAINSTGEHHYICTIGTHCSLGQKLAINVTAPPSPPTPAPVPAPSTPMPVPTPPMPAPAPPMSAPTPSVSPSPTPTPTPTPTPMSMPTPMPAPAPGPGMGMSPPPSGGPSMGGPGSAPSSMTSPGDMSPPAPSSATLSTMSATLAVVAVVAFGLAV